MRILYFLFAVSFFFISCSSKLNNEPTDVNIDINSKADVTKAIVSIESICLLETNDSTLIGNVGSMEYFSNHIYLLDIFSNKSLFVFSDDGFFINRTLLGRGPKELINPYSFCLDKFSKEVFVWDQTLNTMFTFDIDLNYKSQIKYQRPIQDFAILNKNEILVQSQFYKDYIYKLYSSNFDTILGQYIEDYPSSGIAGLLRPISNNKRILLLAPWDYNVYILANRKIHSEYYFDFGNYKLRKEECENGSVTSNWALINSGQRVSSLYEIAENRNFLLFHVYFNHKTIYYAYSIYNGIILRINDYFENGFLPICDVRGAIDNDLFFALVEPDEMRKFQNTTGKKYFKDEIKTTNNPYFMTFRIIMK